MGARELGIDVPVTFEPLDIGVPESGERPPGCLHTQTVKEIGTCHGADGFTPLYVSSIVRFSTVFKTLLPRPAEPFSFELTGDRGAALVTRHPAHRKDFPLALKSGFQKYIKHHYQSWVEFARDKGYGGDIQPILVTGFDVTRDFAMVAYSNEDCSLAPKSTTKGMFASAPHSFRGKWRFGHLPHATDGPNSPPVGQRFNQCIFIRYYTMRPRSVPFFAKKVPKRIRARAGPHNLGSGNNQGETFPELVVQYDVEPTASSYEDPGRPLGPIAEGAGSEQGGIIQNTPYVWFLLCTPVSALKLTFRMRDMTVGMPLQIMYSR